MSERERERGSRSEEGGEESEERGGRRGRRGKEGKKLRGVAKTSDWTDSAAGLALSIN